MQIVPLTSRTKPKLPVHAEVSGGGLSKKSTALAERIQTIDKSALIKKIGIADSPTMEKIGACLMIQLGIEY